MSKHIISITDSDVEKCLVSWCDLYIPLEDRCLGDGRNSDGGPNSVCLIKTN